jgi:FkbM family methyltransferase
MLIHGLPASRFFISRFLWATRLSSLFTFHTASGYNLRFYPSTGSATMWCNPYFYKNEEQILQQHLRPGDIFVDVGANIGCLTLFASQLVGNSGHVFSIEPHPRTVSYLRGNVALNRRTNITVIHAAIGDHKGSVCLSDRRSDDQNRVVEAGVPVQLDTLDSLLPDVHIRLLKIDTEGFELFALRGAQRTLQNTDLVYVESCEEHFQKYGYSTPDLLALLTTHGFDTGHPPDYLSQSCENLFARRHHAD